MLKTKVLRAASAAASVASQVAGSAAKSGAPAAFFTFPVCNPTGLQASSDEHNRNFAVSGNNSFLWKGLAKTPADAHKQAAAVRAGAPSDEEVCAPPAKLA